MKEEIQIYNDKQMASDKEICDLLAIIINSQLPEAENKIWHAHPVWFLDGNPIVGYSKQKNGIRLMFWSGADFDEKKLNVMGGKFKDASISFNNSSEIETEELERGSKNQQKYNGIIRIL